MRFLKKTLLPLAALVCLMLPRGAGASSCLKEIVVPIQFEKGAVCWRHVGVGTTFTGQFAANQRVTAIATGQSFNADANRTWVTTGPWQLTLTGPGGFFASVNGGQLNAALPRSGAYSFTIGPCAVWGNQGTIEICTQ